MIALFVAAAAWTWPMGDLDRAWARLAQDAITHNAAGFAADRADIARLDEAALLRWGANARERYRGPGYEVSTFQGPTQVRGERSKSAYFAIVTPNTAFQAPTLWEVTPGYPTGGRAFWSLTVSGCDLATGDPLSGHPHAWTPKVSNRPPPYEQFKAELAAVIRAHRAFPADTATSHTPGTTCLYVGGITSTRLFSDPPAKPGD